MNYLKKKFIFKIFALSLSIFFLLFLSFLNFSLNKNIDSKNFDTYTIKSGDSISKTLSQLKSLDLLNSTFRAKIILYLFDINPAFINGKYYIDEYETEYTMILKFLNGKIIQDTIIIYEGLTYKKIIDTLINSKLVKYSKNENYYKKIFPSRIKYLSPEGSCFPDTYKFSSGITLDSFLERCVKNMDNILMKYWNNRDFSLPYRSPYEMLIMASIIEKETSIDKEKPIISGVFINRINKNMRLQADPTVIYGIKNFQGNITKKDLQTVNEYNTYKIDGLPRTPICSPGESSIKAASKPEKNNYLYFVADDKGNHIFSENYKNHLKAVNKYQK